MDVATGYILLQCPFLLLSQIFLSLKFFELYELVFPAVDSSNI